MSEPRAHLLARTSDATKPPDYDQKSLEPFDWCDVQDELRSGPGPCWLGVVDAGASRVRPVCDQLDADYAAPTSGGPPFHAFEITPTRAFAFPTTDQREPTWWTWDG